MGQRIALWQRPGLETTAGDHERRIGILERQQSGHIVEDEGTPLTQRPELNFVGAGVTATDSGGKTVVTIPGYTPPGTGIYFDIANSGNTLDIATTGAVNITSGDLVTIFGQTGLHLGSGDTTWLEAIVGADDYILWMEPGNNLIQFSAAAGLTIPLLRMQKVAGVWEYHIQAGATWVADL